MRRAFVLAGLIALAAPVASIAEPVECGGIAPVRRTCSIDVTLGLVNRIAIDTSPDFLGRITATLSTVTGSNTLTCRWIPGVQAFCAETIQGTMIPGQIATLSGRVGLAVSSLDVDGPAVGRWFVSVDVL